MLSKTRKILSVGSLALLIGVGSVFSQQGFRRNPSAQNMPLPQNAQYPIQNMPYFPGGVIPRPDGSTLYQTPNIGNTRIQYHSPHFDPRNGFHRNIRVYNDGSKVLNAHIPAFQGHAPVTIPLANPIVMDQMYKGIYNTIPEPLRRNMSPSLFQQNGQY